MSLSRIPLGAAFVGITDPNVMGMLLVVAAATDALDGLIARVSGTVSHVGLLLDPLCDKLFVLLALSALLSRGRLDWASFLILILRDLFAGGSYLIARAFGVIVPFRPRLPGKIATGLQLLSLLALIFRPRYVPLLVLLVGIVSVYSIIDYGDRALRRPWKRMAA